MYHCSGAVSSDGESVEGRVGPVLGGAGLLLLHLGAPLGLQLGGDVGEEQVPGPHLVSLLGQAVRDSFHELLSLLAVCSGHKRNDK